MSESVQPAATPRPSRSAVVFTWIGAAGMALVLLALVVGGIPHGARQARIILVNDAGWILLVVGSLGRLRVPTFGSGTPFRRTGTWLQVATGAVYLGFRAYQLLLG